MYYTETEIMSQHEALLRTYDYVMGIKRDIEDYFNKNTTKRFVFLGCGSSYMLAKSAQRLFGACKDTSAVAIAGGDYLVNPDYYANTVENSIIVTLSRSGQTSEIVRDCKQLKEKYNSPIMSLSMKADNDIMQYSDMDLTMDWCYDQSVCQTRTVTNLYVALVLLCAIYNQDEELIASVKEAIVLNEDYKKNYRPTLAAIAGKAWKKVIVLADGATIGIAEEGSLAFAEISMLQGQCFNLLDYRHGPMVLNDQETLTIVLVQPCNRSLQKDMIEDLKKHNGILVTVSNEQGNPYEADAHICIGNINRFEAWGISFIYCMQMLAYEKAILLGTNPDEPTGLDAYITL